VTTSLVELVLYGVAIVLAVVAVWELFPKEYRWRRGAAFAGALLTLYLTFFMTSLRIEGLRKEVDVIAVDAQLKALAVAKTPSGSAAYAAIKKSVSRLSSLYTTHRADLTGC
jgi:hypothetical protein